MGGVNGQMLMELTAVQKQLGRSWARAAAPPELCPGVRDETLELNVKAKVENKCKAFSQRALHMMTWSEMGMGEGGVGCGTREEWTVWEGKMIVFCFLENNSWYYSMCLEKGVQGGRQEKNELRGNCHRNKQKSREKTLR